MLRRQTADALSELDLDRGVRDSKAMTELVTDLAEESVSVHELCRATSAALSAVAAAKDRPKLCGPMAP
jgi:hypothetical protein